MQRLEETGVLPQAHQAMLEDMLEGWTGSDVPYAAERLVLSW